jgi:flavin-dependent dehydrogenase
MTDGDIMARNHLNHKEEWMKYFNKTEHTKARFIGCNLFEEPRIFSASSRMLSRNTYENMWMAVGDAALAVDPLSAGGILYALKSSRNVANALDQWLSGDSSSARSYDAQIDKDWHHYLNKRAFYYNLETRWPEALFWKRRSLLI